MCHHFGNTESNWFQKKATYTKFYCKDYNQIGIYKKFILHIHILCPDPKICISISIII